MDHIEKDLPDQTWRRRDFSYANFFIIVYPYAKSFVRPFARRVAVAGVGIATRDESRNKTFFGRRCTFTIKSIGF